MLSVNPVPWSPRMISSGFALSPQFSKGPSSVYLKRRKGTGGRCELSEWEEVTPPTLLGRAESGPSSQGPALVQLANKYLVKTEFCTWKRLLWLRSFEGRFLNENIHL